MTARILSLVALLIALGRFAITGIPSLEGAYEAVSHIFVGVLIGIYFYDRRERIGPAKLYGLLALLLTILESVMFVIQKMGE